MVHGVLPLASCQQPVGAPRCCGQIVLPAAIKPRRPSSGAIRSCYALPRSNESSYQQPSSLDGRSRESLSGFTGVPSRILVTERSVYQIFYSLAAGLP
jgi:hypothetical protein